MLKIKRVIFLVVLVMGMLLLGGCSVSDGTESLSLAYTLSSLDGNVYIEIKDPTPFNGTRISHRSSGEYEIHCDFGPDSVVTLPKETMPWDGNLTYQETWKTPGICYMGQELFDKKLSLYDLVSTEDQ